VSSVINPVGPEEPRTYWQRRALVVAALLGVLLVLWLIVRAALGGGGGDGSAAPAPSESPSFGLSMTPEPSASPGATASTTASGSPSGSVSPTTSPSPSASATGVCADDDIRVAVAPASASTAVGAGMALTMTVTNTSDSPCSRDVGAGANELQVTSGSVLVWSSDYCAPSKATDVTVLKPGKSWSTSITWPGKVTAKGCPSSQPTAQPGTYRAQASNGGVASSREVFVVG
jgi:hypothetical protein